MSRFNETSMSKKNTRLLVIVATVTAHVTFVTLRHANGNLFSTVKKKWETVKFLFCYVDVQCMTVLSVVMLILNTTTLAKGYVLHCAEFRTLLFGPVRWYHSLHACEHTSIVPWSIHWMDPITKLFQDDYNYSNYEDLLFSYIFTSNFVWQHSYQQIFNYVLSVSSHN